MKTKRIPIFYILLLLLFVTVIVLVQIGKNVLTDILTEYEDSQYKYVAEDFFNDNFTSGNGETFAKLFSSQISEYETFERAAAYFMTLTDGKKFTLRHSSTGVSDVEKYVVSIDNLKFAEFYIEKTDYKTEHGFDTYGVTDVLFNENLYNTYSVQVPVGYVLYVNDKIAEDVNAVGDRIETESQNFMPEGVDGIIYTTYKFDKMFLYPTISVFEPKTNACAEVNLGEDGIIHAEVVYGNEELAKEYTDYVIAATKAYACYMQKDAGFGKVKGYLDPASDFYKYVKETPTWPVITHNGYAFENEEVKDFYAYSDDVFSCRITFTHVLKYSGLEDYRDNIDITWYLRKVDGKYLIYDSFTN